MLPTVSHVDHTEHDIKCIITEHGHASNLGIVSPRARALGIVERCAHPYFRPLLREYLALAGDGSRAPGADHIEGWWRSYDAACLAFPRSA